MWPIITGLVRHARPLDMIEALTNTLSQYLSQCFQITMIPYPLEHRVRYTLASSASLGANNPSVVHHLTKTRSWSGQSEILQQQADLLSLLDRRVTSLNGFEVSTGLRKMASIDMDFLVDLSNKSGDAAIMRSPKARRILQRSEDHRNPQFLSELFEENPASDLMVVKDPLYVGPITEDSGYCTHLLIEAGFDLRTPSEFNPEKTLLWAATQGHDILVRCLIAGLHIQLSPDKLIFFVKASTLDFIEPSTDDTPLLKAARNGHERCLRILLDHGANISHVSRTSQTALILASARGFTECVTTLLLFPGVNVHAQDIEGSTALILAASAGYVNVVSMLLNAGSDVNIRNSSGKTALARATRRGHARVVALLAMTKGIVDLPDVRGETAMGWAEKSLGNGEMFAILQKLHARRNEDLISTN